MLCHKAKKVVSGYIVDFLSDHSLVKSWDMKVTKHFTSGCCLLRSSNVILSIKCWGGFIFTQLSNNYILSRLQKWLYIMAMSTCYVLSRSISFHCEWFSHH